MASTEFTDDFDAAGLDTGTWIASYLPMWSSRAASAATYAVESSELRLTIPPEHGLWCPGDHEPLRVSGLQSGVFSGPVGSTIGQQPFRDGVVVREFQPPAMGLDAALRAARGARTHGAQPALDGGGVDGRPGGRADALRGDLHLRGLRRRPARRGARPDRGGGYGRAPVPRPGDHRRVRRRARGDRRDRVPRLRRRLAARARRLPDRRRAGEDASIRPRTTRCR